MISKNHIKQNIFSGLTGAMLIGSYALGISVSAGLGKFSFLFFGIICVIYSLNLRTASAFHPFYTVPLIYITAEGGISTLILCGILGLVLYYILKSIFKNIKIPSYVLAGGALAFCLTATVLLTNQYFGIGAIGSNAVTMLKSYTSLGFHPNFNGLLYGTVTLFAMITYPFKFKKLNKHLPCEFVTLLIPLVMNLFLNPTAKLTSINEVGNIFNSSVPSWSSLVFSEINYTVLFRGSLCLGLIFFALNRSDNASENTGKIRNYNIISALICVSAFSAATFLFPNLIARIPLHCIGAMLIVACWQSLPYGKLAESFKVHAVLSSVCIAAICIVFFFCGVYYGIMLSFILTFVQEDGYGKK